MIRLAMLATLFYTIGEAFYELVKKRTFLMMSVIMGLYSIVLASLSIVLATS